MTGSGTTPSVPAVSAADQAAPIREAFRGYTNEAELTVIDDANAALDALVARCEQLEREKNELDAAFFAWRQKHSEKVEQLERERDEARKQRAGGGDDYRLQMLSNARERMHAAEDRADRLAAALRIAASYIEDALEQGGMTSELERQIRADLADARAALEDEGPA